MLDFLIGIQARSTSTRLPGKCNEMIGDKKLIDHVIDACTGACDYTNRYTNSTGVRASVVLLVPLRDPLADEYRRDIKVVEGSEHDVLARYAEAMDLYKPNYLVRVTGDCPLIPEFIITKHMKIAAKTSADYVSNVDPRFRTAPDGYDCEVISRKLFEYVNRVAREPHDREHVTSFIRSNFISWAVIKHVHNNIDLSDLKISVDTPEDLARVREHYDKVINKKLLAKREYGYGAIHTF